MKKGKPVFITSNGYFTVLDENGVIDKAFGCKLKEAVVFVDEEGPVLCIGPAMSDWDSMIWYEIDSAVLWPAVRKAMQVLIAEGKAKRHHVRKKP